MTEVLSVVATAVLFVVFLVIRGAMKGKFDRKNERDDLK